MRIQYIKLELVYQLSENPPFLLYGRKTENKHTHNQIDAKTVFTHAHANRETDLLLSLLQLSLFAAANQQQYIKQSKT